MSLSSQSLRSITKQDPIAPVVGDGQQFLVVRQFAHPLIFLLQVEHLFQLVVIAVEVFVQLCLILATLYE